MVERLESTLLVAGAETLGSTDDGDVGRAEGGLPEGTRIGRYLVLHELGRGGMGVVHAAYDPELDRKVAIKLLHAGAGRSDVGERNRRLVREAQTLARLAHPHVIAVHDVGTFGGRVFIAMELVEGGTLRQWLAQPRAWRDALALVCAAGRGLAAAHAEGLVHRDFKPENVLVAGDAAAPRVVVADFGLARAQPSGEREHSGPGLALGSLVQTPLTQSGALLGTPMYMAPEQHLGREPDPKSDQFSFAVACWEALYGQRPFDASTLPALVFAVTTGAIVLPRDRKDVPARIHAALLRALAVEPEARWPDLHRLLAEIERGDARPRRGPIVAGLAIVAVTSAALFATGGPETCEGGADRIAEVWNDDTRARIGAAFAASGARQADTTASTVIGVLDRRAQEWATAHREACLATAQGEQSAELLDARMLCLARRQRELGALARLLGEADAKLVGSAVEASHRLPALDACADAEALAREDLPTDPELRRELDAIEDELAELEALRFAGRFSDALARGEPLLARVQALGRTELEARVQLVLATIYDRAGRYPEALEAGKAAAWAAEAAGLDRLRIDAIARVVTTLGERLRRTDEAADWVELGRAVLARAGQPERQLAGFEEHVGNLYYALGDYEAALAAKDRAVEIRERISAPDDPVLASLHGTRGTVLNELGRYDEAIAAQHHALELREQIFGSEHPATAMVHNNLGSALFNAGKREEAIAEYERALEIWSATLEPGHPDLGMVHNNLGNAFGSGSQAERELALVHYRQAIEIWTASHGTDDLRVGFALGNVGRVLSLAGRNAEALVSLERALVIEERIQGPEHADLVYVLQDLADCRLALGDAASARRDAERGLAIARARLGADHPRTHEMRDWLQRHATEPR